MARVLQNLATLELKFAQVGHLFARHSGAQPLFSHRVFVLLPGKAHFTRMNFKEFCQRVSNKTGIAAVFQNSHQHMLAFAIGGKAEIFHHQKVLRTGF